MLQKFKANWLSTTSGILGAALGAFATTSNLSSLSATQAAMAFGGCLLFAIQGFVSADAKAPPK